VQTFVRPITQSAPQPVQLAAAPAVAPAAVPKPPAVQLPQSPPLPVAAKRPDVTPPPQTTMAKAPEAEGSWPPAVTLETTVMAMLPMPKPRPAKAPKAFAVLEQTAAESSAEAARPAAESVKPAAESARPAVSSEMHMAKLDDAAVPLPQPKPDVDAAPERESKSSHRASRHHVRSSRTKAEKPALLAFIEKLTTPTRPSRRRR
jgi:hypothetical protein